MRIVQAAASPVITSGSAYAAGNAIGSTITLPKINDFGFSTILTVALIDKADQKAACDILFFSQAPATPCTDKTAASISAADMANYLGHVSLVASDYSDGVASAAAVKFNLWMAVAGAVDNNVYAQIISRGTPTYNSTSALTLKVTSSVDKDQ